MVGLVFSWFFNPRFGLLNELLAVLGFGAGCARRQRAWSIYPMIVAGLWPQISLVA